MTDPILPVSCLDFMRALKTHNNREWFAKHKETYQKEFDYVESFVHILLQHLNTHDVIETPTGKKSLYRIYRDIRFSKDKTPFSTYWGGRFRRAGKQRRGGYYYHLEPGDKSFVLGGFWGPDAQDLKMIRDDIAFDHLPLRAILNSEAFISTFGVLQGEKLKTRPKGYDPAHEAIDLLRYKQFLIIRRFTDEEVLSGNFFESACRAFKNMRPFFDYISEVLTTDMNGVPG